MKITNCIFLLKGSLFIVRMMEIEINRIIKIYIFHLGLMRRKLRVTEIAKRKVELLYRDIFSIATGHFIFKLTIK